MIDYGFHAYTTSFPMIVPGRDDDRADGVGVYARSWTLLVDALDADRS